MPPDSAEQDGVVSGWCTTATRWAGWGAGYREVRNVLDRVVRDPLIDAARSSGHQTSYSIYVPEGEPNAALAAGAVAICAGQPHIA